MYKFIFPTETKPITYNLKVELSSLYISAKKDKNERQLQYFRFAMISDGIVVTQCEFTKNQRHDL